MKPYEEIDFPNGFLRWIREDGMYVCSLTEEQMVKFKALHEAPRTWVGLTDVEILEIFGHIGTSNSDINVYVLLNDARKIEAKLKEKNT